MFRIFFSFFILISSLAFTAPRGQLPQTFIVNRNLPNKAKWGLAAFNHAPEIGVFLLSLRQLHQVDVAVETGTSGGATSAFFALCFKDVHTIEIAPDVYQQAKEFLSEFSNVHCHLGSSEAILHQILPSLKGKRTLFYLDAHWNEFWPLLDELKEISKTHKDNCIVVIDDFKIPSRRDIGFDCYNHNECSYEYIKEVLDEVFTEYTYHYLIPNDVRSRGKFVAIPKSWQT